MRAAGRLTWLVFERDISECECKTELWVAFVSDAGCTRVKVKPKLIMAKSEGLDRSRVSNKSEDFQRVISKRL